MDIQSYFPEQEQPLDRITQTGGFASVFRTVACVGDSLSSGEFERLKEDGTRCYYDMFEYSWGQFMARALGCKVYNFSRGGMTAQEYMETFAASKGFWNVDLKCQAYIIALGVNDIFNCRRPLGTVEDIKEDWKENGKTFAGYYGAIVQRYREISPNAKFFFVVPPRDPNAPWEEVAEDLAELLRQLPSVLPNSYVIDLRRYGPVYDEKFKEKFYLHGHLNPMGYRLTADMMMSYLDYIIRHNLDDFKNLGFVPHS